jgi:hypothetical protein
MISGKAAGPEMKNCEWIPELLKMINKSEEEKWYYRNMSGTYVVYTFY